MDFILEAILSKKGYSEKKRELRVIPPLDSEFESHPASFQQIQYPNNFFQGFYLRFLKNFLPLKSKIYSNLSTNRFGPDSLQYCRR